MHLPLATLMSESFRRGQWPLWDPFTYCGMPIFANIQAASFYPPVLAATLAGAWLGTGLLPRLLAISVVLQIVFAGWCALELLRRLGIGLAAAWIGATVYELGCFFAAQAEHMGAMQGTVWLPLVWLCVVVLRDGLKRTWLAILAIALAMPVLAGLPQVAVAAFTSAIALALLLALFKLSTWRLAAVIPLVNIWSILIAAVQFFPAAELTQNSVAKYRVEWLGSGGGIPPRALLSLIVPNYWNVFNPSKFHGPTDLTFLYLYSSLLGLALAIGAMIWRPGSWARIFSILFIVCTLAMLGDTTPVGRFVLAVLPAQIRIGIHPEFFLCTFSLSLAVLAGLGAEKVLRSQRLQVAAAIVIALELILVSSGRPMNVASTESEPGMTHDSAEGSTELVTQLRKLTDSKIPPYRYDARPGVSFLWSNSGPLFEIPTSNGCDPLAPERVIEIRRAFATGPRWGTCYQVENLGSPVPGLMNVRALLSREPLNAPEFRLVSEIGRYKIYENLAVLERFFFVGSVRPVGNLREAAAIVQAPDFRPAEYAVVEAPDEVFEESLSTQAETRVISYAPAASLIETTSPAPAFLIATDAYYPGWEARIDGHPARIYPTDAAFRGIRIPAGRHMVEMRFVPRTLYRSAMISALVLLCTVGCFLRRRGHYNGIFRNRKTSNVGLPLRS